MASPEVDILATMRCGDAMAGLPGDRASVLLEAAVGACRLLRRKTIRVVEARRDLRTCLSQSSSLRLKTDRCCRLATTSPPWSYSRPTGSHSDLKSSTAVVKASKRGRSALASTRCLCQLFRGARVVSRLQFDQSDAGLVWVWDQVHGPAS